MVMYVIFIMIKKVCYIFDGINRNMKKYGIYFKKNPTNIVGEET